MHHVNVRIQSTGSAYAVRIGSNLLAQAGAEAKAAARSPKAALVTDAHVAAHYLEPAMESLRAAGLAAAPIVVPPGEASKTLAQAGRLYDAMLKAGLDRGSVVVGLGGGVVTDLAGFAAATYMRGVPWVAVATSLLAQVDAGVGGKTGVDHPECKNLIGAFHQPAAVLADVSTLATLPDEELRTGLAEVVKHAMIRDADLLALIENQADRILARDPAVLEEIVARNVQIKADVVMADEREADLRRILNYGHTVGHALESLALEAGGRLGGAGAPAMTHGRAVALGMMAEARIAERRGLVGRAVVERQKQALQRLGLPIRAGGAIDLERCLAIMRHDKKAEAGRLRLVLPEAIGSVRIADDVTDDEIRLALQSLA
jgi:3-dehydroquinate synthase